MDPIMILIAIVALPLIFFIPGYVTFTVFKVNKIENLKLSFFETVFLQILSSIVIAGLVAFTLAMLGYFSLLALSGLLLIYCTIIGIKFRVTFNLSNFPKPILNKQFLLLLILIILAIVLFFHPFENITLFYDAGPIVNSGVHIGQTGSIVIYDQILAGMPDSIRPIFYQMTPESVPRYYGLQFRDFGLYITDLNRGRIIPQYLQLFPTWIAIFYSIFGLEGFLYVTPLFGVLSIITIYFIGKNLFNWKYGVICAFLLCANFIQIWYSRYPGAEMLFQFLFFSGILLLILFDKTNSMFFGIFSSLCLGLLFLTRVDAFFILIPISIYFIYLKLTTRLGKNHLIFLICFSCVVIYSILYYYYIAYPYVFDQFSGVIQVIKATFPTFYKASPIIFLLCILSYIGILNRKYIFPSIEKVDKYKPYFINFMVFITISILLWAYLNRYDFPPGIGGSNLMMLGWYITDIGVLIGLIGLILMIYKKPRAHHIFILFISVFTLFFLIHIQNQVIHPWAMRRYVSVVMPAIIIGIVNMLFLVQKRISPRLVALTVVLILLINISASGFILNHTENEGMLDQVGEIANNFDSNSIIIFSQSVLRGVSFPLKYIYNRNAILLPKEPDDENIDEFIEMVNIWHQEEKEVYLVNPSQKLKDKLSTNIKIDTFLNYTIETKLLKHTEAKSTLMGPRNDPTDTSIEIPSKIKRLSYDLTIYELKPIR
jgi:hypothetical protein